MQVRTDWFHCTTHTYGAWLPGDSRGFRTRHHREHVEGDYRNPPPAGVYDERLAESRKLLKQPPVKLTPDLREPAARWMAGKLGELGAYLLCLSVGGSHVHLLANMPVGPTPRLWVGYAKRQVTFALKARGWRGEVWATSCKVIPIRDEGHHRNTYHYILDHADEGAWVWDFRREE